jgi:mannose-6-phosphate isomerase-like protein (cupin superfamily)
MKTVVTFASTALLLLMISCNCPVKQNVGPVAEEAPVVVFRDYGPDPFVFDIEAHTLQNELYRQALWTGTHMQMTLMSLAPGEEIGLEKHPGTDQFLRIESGRGIVVMGDEEENLNFREDVEDDFAIFIPAGKWHNVINTGDEPLKIYSIYTPPEHPFGTIHKTYEEGMEAEHDHHH